MEYKIIRSKRKTTGIYILKTGDVEVRCSHRITNSFIDDFVRSKESWIREKVLEKQRILEQKKMFLVEEGSMLLFLGVEYPVIKGEAEKAVFEKGSFVIPYDCSDAKSSVKALYKSLAKKILVNKTEELSKVVGWCPVQIRINSAKTRWGSCGVKNTVNFSWKLIMANESAVDYVVIHELAHIVEHNHQKTFWSIVEAAMPDYKKQKEALENLRIRLEKEDWE